MVDANILSVFKKNYQHILVFVCNEDREVTPESSNLEA